MAKSGQCCQQLGGGSFHFSLVNMPGLVEGGGSARLEGCGVEDEFRTRIQLCWRGADNVKVGLPHGGQFPGNMGSLDKEALSEKILDVFAF